MRLEPSLGHPVTDDALIQAIYRGPLEATPWQGFLRALAARIGCANAGIVLRLSSQGIAPMAIWGHPIALSEADARRIQAIHAEIGHLDPLRNRLSEPGMIATLDEVLSREALQHNRFYREVLAPYGFERMLGMYVSEPGGWQGNIGVVDGADVPDFGEDARALLVRLRHHIEQSLEIFARIMREETERKALITTLDRLMIATYILADDGAILRMNSAGRGLLAAGEIVTARDNRLALVGRAADGAFEDILSALRGRATARPARPFVEAMKVETGANRHVGLMVRSVERPNPFAGEAVPTTIVYVSTGRVAQPLDRLVMQLFDMTPSEAHLATLLATGSTLAEAAGKLGLTENTVRTYCKTIMSKVGVSRQADLVTLILQSVAVLG